VILGRQNLGTIILGLENRERNPELFEQADETESCYSGDKRELIPHNQPPETDNHFLD
jgi:hypothetical protein